MTIQKHLKSVTVFAFSLLSFNLSTLAQEPAPVADRHLPRLIQIYTEMFEISALEYAEIMSKPSTSSNHTALRNKLIAQVKAKKVKLVSSQSLISRSGERSTSESINELIYATEYEPAEAVPQKKGNPDAKITILPPTPTAFETRNVGTTIEVETTIKQDLRMIDLTFKPEVVKHLGFRILGEWINGTNVEMPIFYTIRMNTSLTVLDGQFILAGTNSPQVDGKEDSSKKILFFVKASILKVEK